MRKHKRALLWAGVLVVLAGMGMVGTRMIADATPGATTSNFARIEVGMPRSEVMLILGHNDAVLVAAVMVTRTGPGVDGLAWSGNHGSACVIFDNYGRVSSKRWNPHPLPLIARLRRWLRL